MKRFTFLILFLSPAIFSIAQKKTTTSAVVSVDATTPKDNKVKTENKAVIASVNTKTGDVAFEAAVKNFSFANAEMEGHFKGPEWLDSDKFPKMTFSGKFFKVNKIKFNRDGVYAATVDGTMTVKGISKQLSVQGTVNVSGGKIRINSNFTIKLADYNISSMYIDNGKVAKEPKISISADF
jgi:polyisoprenoid-binding protein YceI